LKIDLLENLKKSSNPLDDNDKLLINENGFNFLSDNDLDINSKQSINSYKEDKNEKLRQNSERRQLSANRTSSDKKS
jgi:hypothetical protein